MVFLSRMGIQWGLVILDSRTLGSLCEYKSYIIPLNLVTPVAQKMTSNPRQLDRSLSQGSAESPESPRSPSTASGASKRALIAYDGSEGSKKALQYAAGLLRTGDHVVLATVLPLPGSPKLATVPLLSNDSPTDSQEDSARHNDFKQAALDALDSASQILLQKGITVTSHVVFDADTKSALQRLGELHHCDLVILGKEKRGTGIVQRMRRNSLSDTFMSSNLNVIVVN
jgi:nucleotide-binding universal stress UspA family protein